MWIVSVTSLAVKSRGRGREGGHSWGQGWDVSAVATAKESTARASLPRAVLDPRGSPGLSQLLRYARCVDRSGPARDEPLRLAVLHPASDGGLGDTRKVCQGGLRNASPVRFAYSVFKILVNFGRGLRQHGHLICRGGDN